MGNKSTLAGFWQRVLLDSRQPPEVRAEVLKRLRAVPDQAGVLQAIVAVATTDANPRVRLRATGALGDFASDTAVSAALAEISGDSSRPLEDRYFALTSLERGGPNPSALAFVSSLRDDAELGK